MKSCSTCRLKDNCMGDERGYCSIYKSEGVVSMYTIEQRIKDEECKIVNYKDYKEEFLYDDNSDKYFRCIDSMQDWYKNQDLKMPKYAYGCYFEPVSLDLDGMLEQATEEHAEDMIDMLDGISELQEAIDKFNEVNKKTGTYYEDLRLVIELF